MNNKLMQYLQLAKQQGLHNQYRGRDPYGPVQFNADGMDLDWAAKMAAQDQTPDTPAPKAAPLDLNALRSFLPQPAQQSFAMREEYDDAGMPVGRNYGRQMEANGRRAMAENVAINNAATGGPAMQQRQIPNELLAMMLRAKPDFWGEPTTQYAPQPYVRPRIGG